MHIAAAEPAESVVLSGKPKGSHKIEGIGFDPPLWDPAQVNTALADTTEASDRMCRRLAREEGIFGGTSSGLNVIAAFKLAQKRGAEATIVTLIIDSGLR